MAQARLMESQYERADYYRDCIHEKFARLLETDSPDAIFSTHVSMERSEFDLLVTAVKASRYGERLRTGVPNNEDLLANMLRTPAPEIPEFAPPGDTQHALRMSPVADAEAAHILAGLQ